MNTLHSTLYTLLLLLASNSLMAQNEIRIDSLDKPYFLIFDSLSTGLDIEEIPYYSLYNRVIPWSDLVEWRDEDTITTSKFYQSWWDLEMSNVQNFYADSYHELRDTLRLRSLREQLTVPVIRYNFAYFDSLSFANEYFAFIEGIITETGADPEPYNENEVVLAALISGTIYADTDYDIVFDPGLVLNNSGLDVEEITVTNLNDNEYVVLTPSGTESFNFRDTGFAVLEFLVQFEDQSVFTIYQCVMVVGKPDDHDCDNPEDQVLESDIPYKGLDEDVKTTSIANFQIFYRYQEESTECEHELQKPIIMVDGYDPTNERKIDIIYDNYLKYNIQGDNLGDDLRELGYDIIILNFPIIGSDEVQNQTEVRAYDESNQFLNYVNRDGRDGGADYIQRNAMLLVKLIQQVNDSLHNNNSQEEIVIVGPSMGGLISRYALAYMEKEDENEVPEMEHNTRLWISFDSPHLGANIPIGNQQTLSNFGAYYGMQMALDVYNQQITTYAGRQLLIEQLELLTVPIFGYEVYLPMLNNSHPYRINFLEELLSNGVEGSNGFPISTRNVSLINGSGSGTNSYTIGGKYMELEAFKNIIKAVTLENRYLNSYNTVSQTHYSKVKPEWYSSITITNNVTNQNPRGSMDIVPGGLFGSNLAIKNDADIALVNEGLDTHWGIVVPNHTFTPTISSLSFIASDLNWSSKVNDRHLVCEEEIPFDNYYIPVANQYHVTLTTESAEWVIQEILKGEKNCPTICSFEISGATRVCTGQNETYILDVSPPTGVTTDWSVSGTLSIVSQNNSSITVSSTGYNQNSKIIANFENPCGANPPQVTKSVISGTGIMGIGFDTYATCYYQAVASIVNDDYSYEWSLNNIHFSSTLPPLEHTYAPNGGFEAGISKDVYLKWTSSCGQDTKHVVFNESQNPPGCSWRPENLENDLTKTREILIFPNPADESFTIKGISEHSYRFSIYDVFGKLVLSDVFIHSTMVQTASFSKGIYVVQTKNETNDTTSHIRLSIQ
jgi:hypothetical protein